MAPLAMVNEAVLAVVVAAAATVFHLQCVGAGVAGRRQEPGAEGRGRACGVRLAREDHEDGLRHVFGEVAVADAAGGGGVDEVQVAVDELGEGGGVAGAGVSVEQVRVFNHVIV